MKKRDNFIEGIVVKNKMQKTLVVKVIRQVMDIRYKKIIRRSTTYFVHSNLKKVSIGSVVVFKETAPISKRKFWILYKIKGQINDTNANNFICG